MSNELTPTSANGPQATDRGIYIALRNQTQRSQLEGGFPRTKALWGVLLERPTRFVITKRRFPDGFTGLELCRRIPQNFLLPYVYVFVFSTLNRLGVVAGADDYLVKPLTPVQVRARVMVGRRWLAYIDSLHKLK